MEPTPISEIVDELFKTRRHASGREFRYSEIVDDLYERFAITVDPGVLRRVRTGETPNPTASTIRAFILFFGVSPSTFFPLPDQELPEKPAFQRDEFSVRLDELGMTEGEKSDFLKLITRIIRRRQK